MFFLQLLIVVAGLAALAFSVKSAIHSQPNGDVEVRVPSIILGVVVFIVALFLRSSFGQVPAGNYGVITHFGAVTGRIIPPGLYFINPATDGVELMDVQTHAYKTDAAAASHDLQNVQTQVTLNFRLDPSRVAEVYNTLRRDYGDRIIVPSVQEAVKATAAQYEAEKLITERPSVRDAIEGALRNRLARHGILLDQMSITNFEFSKEFSDAVEAKVVATQQALKAENDLRTITTQAQQAVATAKGQAEAIRIQAEAIEHQGGDAYVKLQAIQKWNGVLPQYMTGNTPVPFIDVNSKRN